MSNNVKPDRSQKPDLESLNNIETSEYVKGYYHGEFDCYEKHDRLIEWYENNENNLHNIIDRLEREAVDDSKEYYNRINDLLEALKETIRRPMGVVSDKAFEVLGKYDKGFE